MCLILVRGGHHTEGFGCSLRGRLCGRCIGRGVTKVFSGIEARSALSGFPDSPNMSLMPSVSGEAEHGTPSDDTKRTMSMNASHGSFVTRACCMPIGLFSADVPADLVRVLDF